MELDSRRERRHQLIFYLPVNDRNTGEQLGVLGDITSDGLLLIGREAIPAGSQLELEIVNNTSHELPMPLPLRGYSVWTQADVNPDYKATGIELTANGTDTRAAIATLVDEIGLTDHI